MFPTLHWGSTVCKDYVAISKIYVGYNVNYVQKTMKLTMYRVKLKSVDSGREEFLNPNATFDSCYFRHRNSSCLYPVLGWWVHGTCGLSVRDYLILC